MSVIESKERGLLALAALAGGQGVVPRMPDRLKLLLVEQEAQSERVIGWAQLMVGLTFATLYLVAPRPADAGMSMYQPVPIALAAYILFTSGRLLLSYRTRLPGWLVVLSILFDMALLLGLIWSFHIQYGQPEAFSLKVPTFLYIFVFVALRALRFDPRYVLTAGLAAAFGWLAVVMLAIQAAGPQGVTRNFVTYLTSNTVLIGAEFDKIFTVLLVTGILALALWRARCTLLVAVKEQAASREIGRFLSGGLAERIATSEVAVEAGDAAERNAAIVMLDIRGFTRFSGTVPPGQVVEMLTSFHARAVPVIRQHSGIVDKFLGDGIMATFGALTPSETAAADALRALDEVMRQASEWQVELRERGIAGVLEVNGAMAAGPVVFATLGSGDRLEYTVIGEAVNLAAKLEKHNKTEGTRALTTAGAFALAVAQGYVPDGTGGTRLTRRKVGGVDEPLDLHIVARSEAKG